MSAQRGSNSRSYSADPRPNLPERPENQAFPLIQADRQGWFAGRVDLPSI